MLLLKRIAKGVVNYLIVVGVLFNLLVVLGGISAVIGGYMLYQSYQLPPHVFLTRASKSMASNKSPLVNRLAKPTSYLASWLTPETAMGKVKLFGQESIIGAHSRHSLFLPHQGLSDQRLDAHYQHLVAAESNQLVVVETTAELLKALSNAQAGMSIVLSPGSYQIDAKRVYLNQSGTANQPIVLKALSLGDVSLQLNSYEGFVVQGDHWIIENLRINGICEAHTSCEHAFHLVGSSNVIIRNNQVTNFNSIIKANGRQVENQRHYPDNVLIEQNSFYNDTPRKTHTAVTHIDVVAGNDWIVRRNLIAGNSKNGSDRTSYAAFLKGNSSRGLIEQNIVDCDWTLEQDGSTRVGLSLGGGGTGQAYCRDGVCASEHTDGVIRDNLIVNCQQDVGIYLNKAASTQIIHNSLINNFGIDVRFAASTATASNNKLTSYIRTREGGQLTEQNNQPNAGIDEQANKVNSLSQYDLCGFERNRLSVVGALTATCQEKINIVQEIIE